MAYKFERLEVWGLALDYAEACQHMIQRRQYLQDPEPLREAYRFSQKLFAKLQAFRASLKAEAGSAVREEPIEYEYDPDTPF